MLFADLNFQEKSQAISIYSIDINFTGLRTKELEYLEEHKFVTNVYFVFDVLCINIMY